MHSNFSKRDSRWTRSKYRPGRFQDHPDDKRLTEHQPSDVSWRSSGLPFFSSSSMRTSNAKRTGTELHLHSCGLRQTKLNVFETAAACSPYHSDTLALGGTPRRHTCGAISSPDFQNLSLWLKNEIDSPGSLHVHLQAKTRRQQQTDTNTKGPLPTNHLCV